jgi:hypothetical protein
VAGLEELANSGIVAKCRVRGRSERKPASNQIDLASLVWFYPAHELRGLAPRRAADPGRSTHVMHECGKRSPPPAKVFRLLTYR